MDAMPLPAVLMPTADRVSPLLTFRIAQVPA